MMQQVRQSYSTSTLTLSIGPLQPPEQGNSMACIFIDLSKAFDSLSHHPIIKSLARVGICGSLLAWIKDYFTNRLQQTALSGSLFLKVPSPLLSITLMDSITSVNLSVDTALTMFAVLQGSNHNSRLFCYQNRCQLDYGFVL